MKQFSKFTLPSFASRGYQLTPIEHSKLVPFTVVRTYFLSQFTAGATTGEHCHKVEEEIFVVTAGSVTVVIDYGKGKEEMTLKSGDAIYVPNYVWHGFKNPSSDAIILALSSTPYTADRSDYIEDYAAYLQVRDANIGNV